MNRSSRAITYVPLGKWLIIEMAVLLILSLLWLLESRLAGYSALIGGLIFVIPNAYFAHRAYRYQGARQMHLAVSNIFRAESIKLALTAVFFCGRFHFNGASPRTGSVIHFCCDGCVGYGIALAHPAATTAMTGREQYGS